MSAARVKASASLHVIAAIGLLALFRVIYPGTLVVLPGALGLAHAAAGVLTWRGSRTGAWLSFVLGLAAAAFSIWGVYRYLVNGFDFALGNFAGRAGIHWPAYLFALVALCSISAGVLHAAIRLRTRGSVRRASGAAHR